jgi:hypothetical protein
MTDRFIPAPLAQGGYPDRLLALRRAFTPDPGYEHANILPIKYGPSGRPELGLPEAVLGAGRMATDLLASPYTGSIPESLVGDVALNALGGRADPAALRTFLGIRSETADLVKLRRAIKLEKSGVTPEMVRQATGWGRDVAGNWNYEISDAPAKFNPQAAFRGEAREPGGQKEMFKLDPKTERARIKALRKAGLTTKLGTVYEHPELYAAHPELADKPVRFMSEAESALDPEALGYSDPLSGEIGLTHKFGSPLTKGGQGKGVVAHEVQHVVQDLEKFPVGSGPGTFKIFDQDAGIAQNALIYRDSVGKWGPERVKAGLDAMVAQGRMEPAKRDAVIRIANDARYNNAALQQRIDFAGEVKTKAPLGPDEAYHRTAGEVQARNVQTRLGMSQRELADVAPEETQDVPNRDQLVIPPLMSRHLNERVRAGVPMSRAELRTEKSANPFFEVRDPREVFDLPANAKALGKLKPVTNPFFDLSRLEEVPDVPQGSMERYRPKKGTSARLQAVLGDKGVQQRLRDIVSKGVEMGGKRWYNTEPLRQAFINELGETEGNIGFTRYMDYVSATSPKSAVDENVRNASYYYARERQGMPQPPKLPTAEFPKNPYPYGHMGQQLHRMNAQRIAAGGFDVLNNPKPPSFSTNLQGNQFPVTVDAHATRLPAILSGDPRWLETSVRKQVPGTGTKGGPPKAYFNYKPRQLNELGELPIEEALQDPTAWVSQPNRNEYAALEDMYQNIGRDLGITPAQVQASAWIAGGEHTGLGSDSSKAFMDFFEDRLQHTANYRKVSREKALQDFIRGNQPLLARSNPFGPVQNPVDPETGQPIERNRLLSVMGNQS